MIKPEAGCVMHLYFADIDTARSNGAALNDISKPCAASCAYVHNDRMVNVGFLDHQGTQCSMTSVQLLQDDDKPNRSYWLEWMPFQREQAAAGSPSGRKTG